MAAGKIDQFPSLLGMIAPAVNIPGVDGSKLNLTGEIFADIFAGKIARWRDPRIVALNADMKLPDIPVRLVYRNDPSGTTFHFTTYLSQVSESWKKKYGVSTQIKWPAGVEAKSNTNRP